jgi:2-oxoglutarate dehydrogenase E2 component (dihydrolipoamide succinyltransferase)
VNVVVDITFSDLPDGGEAVVERWLHKPGDSVRIHEPLVEINTDKAVVEVPSPASGILREILKQVNDAIEPGAVLGRIDVTDAAAAPPPARPPAEKTRRDAVKAAPAELSPAVRQLIKKHNIDASQVAGTGRGGRITHDDVLNYLSQSKNQVPLVGGKVPHTPTRRRIAEHMVESMKTAPHVTAVFDADLSAIIAHRNKHRDDFVRKGVPLTYTAYFVAAAVKALQAVPEINSRWHDDALEIFADCHIGIATATNAGLLVPVVHQAQTLDLHGIAVRLHDLTERARTGKLKPEDLRGGTFTITNHGVSGSLIATPIINQPQCAILGIGKMGKRVVVVEDHGVDSIQIKPMAYVTLTIDHRAVDGNQANTFLGKFVQALDAVQ